MAIREWRVAFAFDRELKRWMAVSRSFVLLGAGVLTFLYLFLIIADYGWENKKRRGLSLQTRTTRLGKRSERAVYEWYSWIRYLGIILLTYINAMSVIESEPGKTAAFESPVRMFWLFLIVILFAIALLEIDGYWDRQRRQGLNGIQTALFWSYFWLRYPALILATIQATRQGLQS